MKHLFSFSSGDLSHHTFIIVTSLAALLTASMADASGSMSSDYIPKASAHTVVVVKNIRIPTTISASKAVSNSISSGAAVQFQNDANASPSDYVDVSEFDFYLSSMRPHVRHYPPNFPNRTARYNHTQKIVSLSNWLAGYADKDDASYEVLIRAAEIHLMARNLDQGEDFAARAGRYIDRAVKLQPDKAEAQFLYGSMLAEGGAFRTGLKYLLRAAELNFHEAHQSIAQLYLLTDRREEALEKLKHYQSLVSYDAGLLQRANEQIGIIESGGYYIWK